MRTTNQKLLRAARQQAEGPNGGHRLGRFKAPPQTRGSKLGPEWAAVCRRCGDWVIVFPEYGNGLGHHAMVSIAQCGHHCRRTTYIIRIPASK